MFFPVDSTVSDLDYSTKCIKNLRGIAFAHLNICHVLRKLDCISNMLHDSDLDILCLSETFLNDEISDCELKIDGYHLLRQDRVGAGCKKNGGGILIYYRDCYDVTCINSHVSSNCELLQACLKLPKSRPIYFDCLYRPPDGIVDKFVEEYDTHLSSLPDNCNYDYIALGDCNIDYNAQNGPKKKLVKLLKCHSLDQMIKQPTRVTTKSKTCIDHIYCNNPDLYAHCGVVDPGLSDHCLVYIVRKRKRPSQAKKTIRIRNYCHFSESSFRHDVKHTDWTAVTTCDDIDTAIYHFNTIFTKLLDRHLPWKKIRVRVNSAPWVTNEFHSTLDARRYHTRIFNRCPCEPHLQNKKQAQRLVQRLKNQLKRSYVQDCLTRYKNDPKKLWREIRQFWPSSKNSVCKIGSINGASTNEAKATILNDHFASVGERLSQKIPVIDSTIIKETISLPPVFELKNVTIANTISAINRLSNTKSCSHDGITAFMLKNCQDEISPTLTYMYNLSIKQRTFPKSWKISKVTPLHKGGSKDDSNNYRPISIIPTVGKVMERLVHLQCTEYLSSHNILSEAQSGFRGGRSTGTCLIDFLDNVYRGIDGGGVCGAVFLDLAKAFDTVSHDLLIMKLTKLGFRYSAAKWFESYLTDRFQSTVVEGRSSSLKSVKCGVPQGSILGPLLFICSSLDMASSTIVNCRLLERYDLNQLVQLSRKPKFFNFNNNISWQTVSKALARSRKSTPQAPPLSIPW